MLLLGYNGQTALQVAAGGHLDIVEKLLVAGADVNAAAGYNGQTALQVAAGGHLDIVEKLLAAGADVNAAAGYNGTNCTPSSSRRPISTLSRSYLQQELMSMLLLVMMDKLHSK